MHRSGDTDQKEPPDPLAYPTLTASQGSSRRLPYSQHQPIPSIPEDAIHPFLPTPNDWGLAYPRPPLPQPSSSDSGSSRSLGMSSVNSGGRSHREGYASVEGWGTGASQTHQDDVLSPSFSYPSQPFSFRPSSPSRSAHGSTSHFLNSPPQPSRAAQPIQTGLPPIPGRSNTSSSVTGWSSSSGSVLSPTSPFTTQLPQLPAIDSHDNPAGPIHPGFSPFGRYETSNRYTRADSPLRAGPSGLGLISLPDFRPTASFDMRFGSGGISESASGLGDVQTMTGQPVYSMGGEAGVMIVDAGAGPSKRRMSGKNNTPAACAACKRAHLACDPGRPCRRCTSIGRPEGCVDIPHKKRGRPKLAEAKSPIGPKPPPLRRASSASLRTSFGGGAGKTRDEEDTRPMSYSGSLGRGFQSRFRSASDLHRDSDHYGSLTLSPLSTIPNHFLEEPHSAADIECVISLNNRLDVTAIVYTESSAIVVLDKACIGHPFCDFIHFDDRDVFRNAAFCALMTDRRAPFGFQGMNSGMRNAMGMEEIVTLLSSEGSPKTMTVVRLKDIRESFHRFRLTIRTDPRQPFMNGNNDLIIGLERAPTTAASSLVGTPGLNDCYANRSPSVQSQNNHFNVNLPNSSPRTTTDTVLPSFAIISAGVAPPRSWPTAGSGESSAPLAPLPGMEGLTITPSSLYSELEPEGSPSSAGKSGLSGFSDRR